MIEFSVMTLNLRFGFADDGPNDWKYRQNHVLELFRAERPHFIATQESNHFQTEFLSENLTDYEYIGKRTPAPGFWQDNILFFRRPVRCVNQTHFFLSETPQFPSRSFGSRYPRQATLGLFSVHGNEVICMNTHLDFEQPAQVGACRVMSEQLSFFPLHIPTVLMGDFNATPQSTCYRFLTGDGEESSLVQPFLETFEKPYPSTFHRFTGKPVAGYIDWILFRGDLTLRQCHVLNQPQKKPYVSDHFPVTATFGFTDT